MAMTIIPWTGFVRGPLVASKETDKQRAYTVKMAADNRKPKALCFECSFGTGASPVAVGLRTHGAVRSYASDTLKTSIFEIAVKAKESPDAGPEPEGGVGATEHESGQGGSGGEKPKADAIKTFDPDELDGSQIDVPLPL
ncbi:hypothetical protein BESB_033940 [Besnoitia besnoiti]|uniref:Uncharacterized protein n=1 Tax=Besnoitia besnoiti TaxID=94643 RepID=A0A2A9MLM1_BESBE|nr:hypothetical protein BESB_033940 [Besnoitia besnoiti]PFH36936.1 hypothetical protein BESB_033940 [Besnoitia besnoiti]